MSLFFEPSLLRCFISCFFLLESSSFLVCSMFYWLLALLDSTFLVFLFINLLFGSLKNKLSFCFLDKSFKKYHWYSFYHKKLLFFLSFINFCFWILFFMRDIQKHFAIFLCFHILFWKISGFFCLNLNIFCSKKITSKKSDSLNFSLVFLLTLFSLFCFVSLCLLSLLLVFSFSTLFLFLFPFSLSIFPLLMFASRYVYLLSLSLALPLLIPFFLKIHFYLFFFFFSFFICSSLFCKTVFVPSPLLFRPFSCLFLFFQSCSFEQDQLTFFFWQTYHLFHPSKNLFPEFLLIDSFFTRSFIVFRFFEIPLKNLFFFEFRTKKPTKWHLQPTMFVPISLSGNLFVFRKNPSLQPLQKNVFVISFLCLLSFKKSFLEKISFEKIVFLKKNKTSFISSWFLLHLYSEQKLFSIFQLSFIFFAFVVLSLFSSFSVRFFWCLFFQTKKRLNKFLSRKFEGFFFFQTFSFELFFRGRNIFWSKKECVQKLSFEFSSKKKSPLKKKKNLFQDSHALRIACANESPLDHCCVSCRCWASNVYVHSVVIHLGRGTSVASSRLSPFFFWFSFCFFWESLIVKKMFCECLSLPFCSFSNVSNTFLTSFGRFFSKIKILMAENSFFLFSFSCFYSHVSCPFFSPHVFVKVIWWQRTKHVTKRNEWSQWWEWSTRSEKGSLVGVFFSMTEGLSWWTWINQGECLGWWFLARLGSNSVFLVIEWLVCDTDSPRHTRKWMLIIISLCFFSLSLHFYSPFPQHLPKSYWKDWATWGGEAEPRGFDGLCRRSKEEDRARNTKNWWKTTQRVGRENKQTGR